MKLTNIIKESKTIQRENKGPCWDGYQQIGMKMKGGKEVPNCVPKNEVTELNDRKVYIDYLNKKKGFKQDRIKFNSYEDAVKWAKKNFERFSPDMIKFESVNEGVKLSLVDPNTNKFIKTLSLDRTYREAEKEVETLNRRLSSSQKAKGFYWKVSSINESVNVNKKFGSKYDIGAGSMGSGTTFWNKAQEVSGDYKTIAHVSDNGKVTFYDKKLPNDVKKHIEDYAKTKNESVNENSKNKGHWERVGNQTLVDSNFINLSKGVLPNSELVHLGGGDFALKTSEGEIVFSRTPKPTGIADDFVGRVHRMTDNKGGKLLNNLVQLMGKSKKAVLSMSEVVNITEGKKLTHKYNPNIEIELIEPTKRGWKVYQTEKGKTKKKIAYFDQQDISGRNALFEAGCGCGGVKPSNPYSLSEFVINEAGGIPKMFKVYLGLQNKVRELEDVQKQLLQPYLNAKKSNNVTAMNKAVEALKKNQKTLDSFRKNLSKVETKYIENLDRDTEYEG